jgi:hypothetical protein
MMTKPIVIIALVLIPAIARAQQTPCPVTVTIPRTDLTESQAVLTRALSLLQKNRHESAMVRRSVAADRFCADSSTFLTKWGMTDTLTELVVPLPARIRSFGNSAYPRDRNDGALWNGVGLNTELSAGVAGKWRFLTASLYPKFIYQQNGAFDYPVSQFSDRSEFANPFVFGIDLPKRMGSESFSLIDLGQSYIQAGNTHAYLAVSNENLWIGPTQVHSLLLSNTAPGIPHVRFGTANPVDLKILWLEAHVIFGSVTESDYLTNANPRSYLYQATVATIEPKFLPNFYLGGARVLRDTAGLGGHSVGYYLNRIIESPFFGSGESGLDPSDRQSGLFARYVLPESGFEVYLEWGREDFPFSFLNLVLEPDYTQVWSAGAQKVFLSDKRLSRLYLEFVHLGQAGPVRGGRGSVRFGATRPPGFTHRGQMLGPGVGPGSDAQTLGFDMFDERSRTGIVLERVRYDEDTYYEQFSRRWSESRHDVEVTGELRRLQFVGPLTIEGALRLSQRWNRDFISAVNDAPENSSEFNLGTELSLRWTPRW